MESQLWNSYRNLCKHEKLSLSVPLTEFLGLVVKDGSPLSVTYMMSSLARERAESFDAYVRVLLNWHKNRVFWIEVTGDKELAVRALLLKALRTVTDPQLRKDIEGDLIVRPRRPTAKTKDKDCKGESQCSPAPLGLLEEAGQIAKKITPGDATFGQPEEMLKSIDNLQKELEKQKK